MNSSKDRIYWLGFSAFPGIGPLRFKLLLGYFKTAENIWKASSEKLLKVGLGPKLTSKFCAFRREFELEKYQEDLDKKSVHYLILTDEKYPKLLRQIKDAPFVLYIKGKKTGEWDISKTIGVVGTRKVTGYGKEVTQRLTRELVNYGFTIVSGMALGVDAVAHETALTSGSKTIAVLGSGVDLVYPPSNKYIYDHIVDGGGAVVSEFPLGMFTDKGLFPSRNRIISGLSLGVLVTEGAEDSGSLITASYAAEQGREVFAVPGPITSYLSKGPTKLIRAGAKLVESAEDIMEELNIKASKTQRCKDTKKIKGDTQEEEKILKLLENEGLTGDEIIRLMALDSSKTNSLLTMMEVKGMIKCVEGRYQITI
ncbi:MAG: protecting protein DprA protein [Candidatus Gottesmanbacteria bacterium GW2011_GWC2_39_8]|uniref:Protecting protein DprA protein n=1 Tax=Candidatus Gottesmanbacteria bacterium GW2011_GWC2_39_8 TaxID=1618450 RepID=A0A0G0T7Y9_9BACT|nr:MAG: protecting protein DprA protein [Candidatus Gottesmanbacteria bacterium GW2011_GWC2_39_8]